MEKSIFDLVAGVKPLSTMIEGEVTVTSLFIPAATCFGPKVDGIGASARCESYGFPKSAYQGMIEEIRTNVFPELKPAEFPTGTHQTEMAKINKELIEAAESPISVTGKQYNFCVCFTQAVLTNWLETPEGAEYKEVGFEDQVAAFALSKDAAALKATVPTAPDAPAQSAPPAEPAVEAPSDAVTNLPATPSNNSPIIAQFLNIVQGNLAAIQETSGDISQIETLLSKIREKQNQQLATTAKMVKLLAENSTAGVVPAEIPATV